MNSLVQFNTEELTSIKKQIEKDIDTALDVKDVKLFEELCNRLAEINQLLKRE